MDTITALAATNSRYGRVQPGDQLRVGEDIDERGAERWLEAGLAKRGDLKKKRSEKPTSDNTVKEIKQWLDGQGIDYDSDARKAELLEVARES